MNVTMSDSSHAVRRIAILMSLLALLCFAWRKLEGKRNKRHRKRLQAQLVPRRAIMKLTEEAFWVADSVIRGPVCARPLVTVLGDCITKYAS